MTDIKEAIMEDRIVSFYQPIFNIRDFKAVKFESLVRMISKERKVIPPGMFLNQIVNTPVYKELTKKIIDYNVKVIRQKNINVSINMLPSDLIDDDIVGRLTALDESVANKITIELLELEKPEYNILRKNINYLKKSGYKIALDDFGSGYSNLTHIVELQFDYIKIDGSLIKRLNNQDKAALSVVKSIANIASELDINLVAEFICSKNVLEKVKEIGIRLGQGNYLQKAVSVSRIVDKNRN